METKLKKLYRPKRMATKHKLHEFTGQLNRTTFKTVSRDRETSNSRPRVIKSVIPFGFEGTNCISITASHDEDFPPIDGDTCVPPCDVSWHYLRPGFEFCVEDFTGVQMVGAIPATWKIKGFNQYNTLFYSEG